MTKEEILEKHCDSHYPEDGAYLDIPGNVIDGRVDCVLSAMDEYAIEVFLWIMKDHGEYKVERREAEDYLKRFIESNTTT